METRMRILAPISVIIVLLTAFALAFAYPQEAMAQTSPWGSGTSYNAKTKTLTINAGNHTIKSLGMTYKGKYYYYNKLVIKGGTTKLGANNNYLDSLAISNGKLISSAGLNISGNMKISGGTVSVSSSRKYSAALFVMDDLSVTGGKVSSKTTKEGSSAINVYGDMRLKKGSVTTRTQGKNANALQVSGFLKISGGSINSTAAGKNATAIRVSGDLFMSNGAIKASSSRSKAIQCYDLLKITSGKVSASSASGEMAMSSGETAIIKPKCLGTIKGALPAGAQFTKNGVTYSVTSNYNQTVKIIKGTKGPASVSFGGVKYSVAASKLTAASSNLAAR